MSVSRINGPILDAGAAEIQQIRRFLTSANHIDPERNLS
jgi:hypothetical protein